MLTSAFQIRSEEESSNRTDIEHFMHPVGRVYICLVEESRLINHRILVLSQMVTASRLIPSRPTLSSISVATQTVMQTYANVSVEAISVCCMPQAEFCRVMREMVQENTLTRIYALLQEMWSSVEAAAAGTELLLNMDTGGKNVFIRGLHGDYIVIF